ncbi:MAG: glutamate ligase domain-containing protein [Thermoguttaceae bacterium]
MSAVAAIGDRNFYNDSASTTPESTIAALRALPPPLWLLAGGVDKGLDYRALVEEITQRAAGAVFFGRAARLLADLVKQRAAWMPCAAAADLREAMEICLARSAPRSTIVLSPACSSHDQYTNYRERGAAFVELVESLAASAAGAAREAEGNAR